MAKFTPGPWGVEQDNDGEGWWPSSIVAANGNTIASFTDDDVDWSEEVWGNAPLIAAAPDLLDILRRLNDALQSDVKFAVYFTPSFRDEIAAAIAKATGVDT